MKRHIGAVLLSGAVLAPLGRFTLVQSVDWTPLDIPLPVVDVSHQFTVDTPGTYELAVRIDRPGSKSDRDDAECLLGFDWVECEGIEPALGLRWMLHADDGRPVRCGAEPAGEGVVDHRSAGGGFTPAIVERWLGCFDASPHTRYTLQVQPLSDHSPLKDLHPRFVVVSSAGLNREEYSATAAVWLMSLLAGLAGFFLVGTRA